MKDFLFVNNPRSYAPNEGFVSHIQPVSGKGQLLTELSSKLNFPDYFGFNWDALNDCLRDFHWINEGMITIVHDELPMLSSEDMRSYIEVLRGSINDWKRGETHGLVVVFADKDRLTINNL